LGSLPDPASQALRNLKGLLVLSGVGAFRTPWRSSSSTGIGARSAMFTKRRLLSIDQKSKSAIFLLLFIDRPKDFMPASVFFDHYDLMHYF
jgi:hypothetical protein